MTAVAAVEVDGRTVAVMAVAVMAVAVMAAVRAVVRAAVAVTWAAA